MPAPLEIRDLSLGEHEVAVHAEQRAGKWSYRMKLGRETIWLDSVEYRILTFLAEQPYRPCSREKIAAAVSTRRQPVTSSSVDQHVRSLRDKLGFFADYVQTVPYSGYRFKE